MRHFSPSRRLTVAGGVAALAAALLKAGLGAAVPAHIVLDGRFDDWAASSPVVVDRADAPASPVDFGEVHVADDGAFVYFLVGFRSPVALQGLDGIATLLLDADGSDRTGLTDRGLPGVDLMVDFSPPVPDSPATPGRGVGVRWTACKPGSPDAGACQSSPYDLEIIIAPSYASERVEFRIRKGSRSPDGVPIFLSDHLAGKFIFVDRRGRLLDETASFESALTKMAPSSTPFDPRRDPLARAPNSAFRVLAWNVSRRSMQEHADAFGRILSALKPDIALLDEVTDESSAERLRQFLSRLSLPGRSWQVVFGAGGGTQRSTVSSWRRTLPVAKMAQVSYPEDQVRDLMASVEDSRTRSTLIKEMDGGVGTVGAWVEVGARRLLTVSLDMACCGQPGGPEDRLRRIQVDAIHGAVRAARAGESLAGVIIGGDFNLVGSPALLDTMAAGLDRDGGPLAVAEALQLDGRSNVTWAARQQPFVPGRLDFLLYSGSTLAVNRAFVFDSTVLSARWLRRHRIRVDDSDRASDHRPVVVDLRWSGGAGGRTP